MRSKQLRRSSISVLLVVLTFVTLCSSAEEPKSTELNHVAVMENRLFDYTAQNTNLKMENTDLWKKVEELEAAIEQYVKSISEHQERAELEKTRKTACQDDVKKFAAEIKESQRKMGPYFMDTQNYRKETTEAEKEIKSCQEELKAARSSCEATSEEVHFKEQLENRVQGCAEEQRILKKKHETDGKELEKIQKSLPKIKKNEEECSVKLKTCTSAKDQLEFVSRGFDLVFLEMDSTEKELKSESKKCQASAKQAIDEATTYRLLLTSGGVVTFIWAGLVVTGWARERLNQRVRDIAESKQREKMAARKKSSHHKL